MIPKMKVLQVIPKLGYGGAETGCYDLAHYLTENNCQSYLITSGGPLLKYIKKDKVRLFRLPVHSKNPLLMILNSIFITLIILFFDIQFRAQVLNYSSRFCGRLIGPFVLNKIDFFRK